MQISQALVRQTILILLACAVVLTGCSRMNLAYRNLDLLIPWSLNDYLDMNRDQQTRFREQLREHISWHCRTQLPGYLDLIEQLQAQVRQGSLDEPALREHYEIAQKAIQTIALEITPTTVQLLRDLDDRQVEELNEQFERDRQEREDKYLKPPLDQQIGKRTDRMQERVEQWLGNVTAAQRQRIHEWAEALSSRISSGSITERNGSVQWSMPCATGTRPTLTSALLDCSRIARSTGPRPIELPFRPLNRPQST